MLCVMYIGPLVHPRLRGAAAGLFISRYRFISHYFSLFSLFLLFGWHPVTVVQYTFTHKRYIEQN
jgi:hypothetical protein